MVADLVKVVDQSVKALEDDPDAGMALEALPKLIDQLEVKMKEVPGQLDFEDAPNMRNWVKPLRQKLDGSSKIFLKKLTCNSPSPPQPSNS